MAKIIGKDGIEWELKFGFKVFTKVFKKLGVTFDSLTKLNLNVGELLESIPEICEKQIIKRGMTVEQFAENIDDVSITDIISAFTEALNDSLQTTEINKGLSNDKTPLNLGNGTTS